MKKIWDNYKRIGEFHKSDNTKIVVELVAKDGVKHLSLREWYMRKRDKEWKPGMRGLTVPVQVPIKGSVETPLVTLTHQIKEVLDEAPGFEIEDEDNAVWTSTKN